MLLKKYFSLKILEKLSFTDKFYSEIEKRLIPKQKFLKLDIKSGEGCGGFTYEFHASELPIQPAYL